MHEVIQKFISNVQQTGWLEFVAVISGIASVWFSKKENVLVYPVGLINTVFYVFISVEGSLYGEATVNLYYTAMSIYGWYLWTKKNNQHQPILHITHSNGKEWMQQIAFFAFFYISIFLALGWLRKAFYANTIPPLDAFASATAFTGMWLMAKKKVESWYWWIATNITSIPLYFIKGYMLTSVYYLILLVLAVFGWIEWKKRAALVKPAFNFEAE
jgi:nicotinamide mononucleotide transporter